MDFIKLIDKLLILNSKMKPGCYLDIHIGKTFKVCVLTYKKQTLEEIKILEDIKFNELSCECTEIYNRIHERVKHLLDNVLPL